MSHFFEPGNVQNTHTHTHQYYCMLQEFLSNIAIFEQLLEAKSSVGVYFLRRVPARLARGASCLTGSRQHIEAALM